MRIFFTHIPKTAGTSFFKAAINPNFDLRHFSGLWQFVSNSWPDNLCWQAHMPYGFHVFKPRIPVEYITFLRDPVERATSHYFFVLSTSTDGYIHPEYSTHKEVSLEEIFDYNRKRLGWWGNWTMLMDNMQTRYLAGIPFSHRQMSDQKLLERAKDNLLRRYSYFGLQNRFEDSLAKFGKQFQTTIIPPNTRFQQSNRPVLTDKQRIAVENANQLDLALFEFANHHF